MTEFSDKQIVTSWHANARPWTKAVQNEEIESRTLVTNQAIVQTVTSLTPRRVLDVGCGEGWLARALAKRGVEVVGIDVVPALIAEAQRLGSGRFQVCSYEDMAAGRLSADRFDAIICNFSLLGKDSVERLLYALPRYVQIQGYVVIQTLHPVMACGDRPYCDGWRPRLMGWVWAGVYRSGPLVFSYCRILDATPPRQRFHYPGMPRAGPSEDGQARFDHICGPSG